ncbi:M48 family metallopeptidase [Desulfovibrio mangrovi]|uniref:M48 family metallopeptidase n=1 Tax=Desulfovibrio mangrovi TaxID=2976983 RepID=UPI002246861F|nr:SprT family zinc-dependent metalloprotease [Desulfovibrio mangrovi]UZP68621.1 M48 family metallopeptidase [Desulfovibrio mangrovi]
MLTREGLDNSQPAKPEADIPYSVRRSARAKRVSLRYSALEGLIVVVPQAYDLSRIPSIVQRKKDWIARVADQFQQRVEQYANEPDFPEAVLLRGAGKVVPIRYAPSSRPFSVRENGDGLMVSGRYDSQRIQTFLREWLKRQATVFLIPLMYELAERQGIVLKDVRIRLQRSRWGSCSVDNTINLNARLMLLPEPMLRYVCLHELAHCVHHNHSKAFWQHLEGMMPEARRFDAALGGAWRFIPRWSYA